MFPQISVWPWSFFRSKRPRVRLVENPNKAHPPVAAPRHLLLPSQWRKVWRKFELAWPPCCFTRRSAIYLSRLSTVCTAGEGCSAGVAYDQANVGEQLRMSANIHLGFIFRSAICGVSLVRAIPLPKIGPSTLIQQCCRSEFVGPSQRNQVGDVRHDPHQSLQAKHGSRQKLAPAHWKGSQPPILAWTEAFFRPRRAPVTSWDRGIVVASNR